MNLITLDYIDNVVVDEFSTITNCHGLYTLKLGLSTLANSVRAEEIKKFQSKFAFEINFQNDLDKLISCYFHWFAVSLMNYARLVGFIKIMNIKRWSVESLQDNDIKKQVKKSCDQYIEAIPELEKVNKWRNKVAAHFAATAPYNKDNISTLQDSIQHPITYSKPHYYTHLHIFGKRCKRTTT